MKWGHLAPSRLWSINIVTQSFGLHCVSPRNFGKIQLPRWKNTNTKPWIFGVTVEVMPQRSRCVQSGHAHSVPVRLDAGNVTWCSGTRHRWERWKPPRWTQSSKWRIEEVCTESGYKRKWQKIRKGTRERVSGGERWRGLFCLSLTPSRPLSRWW